jgi:mono/diheme cytochrome c family protein
MHDQPRHEPLEASAFFADGRASRPRVPGTIARGERERDEHLLTGRIDGQPTDRFPMPIDAELLARGRERYAIYCTPCHGAAGYGDGIVVARGMKVPPSLHGGRLRAAPAGHFVDVITKGSGVMFSYADRTSPRDRWAIAAYVRALQRSQRATLADVPEDEAARLTEEAR